MKVILVATPRSGSMSIYKNLRTRYSLKNNFFEIFNPATANWNGTNTAFILHQWEKWSNTKNSIAKIDPYHIYRRATKDIADEVLTDMLTKCDKIVYCYRRNTAEQINSLALAKKTKEWRRDNRNTLIEITEQEFFWCGESLLFRYEQLISLLKKYEGDVLCMEDVLDYEPYDNRPETKFEYIGPNIEELITQVVK
jgi:hypothetical protein